MIRKGEMGKDAEKGLSDVLKLMIHRYCNENPSVGERRRDEG